MNKNISIPVAAFGQDTNYDRLIKMREPKSIAEVKFVFWLEIE